MALIGVFRRSPPPRSLYRGSTLDSPWALAPRLLSSDAPEARSAVSLLDSHEAYFVGLAGEKPLR